MDTRQTIAPSARCWGILYARHVLRMTFVEMSVRSGVDKYRLRQLYQRGLERLVRSQTPPKAESWAARLLGDDDG